MQYISLIGVKYPSKARFYCVRKGKMPYNALMYMCIQSSQVVFYVEVADSDEEGAGNDASGATAMDTHSRMQNQLASKLHISILGISVLGISILGVSIQDISKRLLLTRYA